MKCIEYLDRAHAHYKTSEHIVPFTSQQAVSEKSDVPGIEPAVAEPIKVDDDVFLFVYPADHAVDFDAVRQEFGAERVEHSQAEAVGDRAEPGGADYAPFGSIYGLLTFIDKRIGLNDFIVFSDPETGKDVRMEMAEYRRITQPRILDFAYSTR